MILSNILIQKCLEEGTLVIDPRPLPLRPRAEGPECPYQTSAVDLRLANEISFFKEDMKAFQLDLRRGGFSPFFAATSRTCVLTDDQPYSLRPGQMILGRTLETVSLPIGEGGDCLAARIEGRSSYARCGLLVHFTAPTIHAGFSGTITLEMINHGPANILLYPGIPICQLIVERVEGIPFKNDSQFQGQARPAGPLPRA